MSAIVDDATAVYWNPAGLSRLVKPEIGFGHVILFEDTTHDYAAGSAPTKRWGGFGAAYIRQSSGGFEKRAGPLDTPVTFTIAQNAFLGGWGGALALPSALSAGWITEPKPLEAGLTVKAVGETIDANSNSGVGADLGLIFRPNERWLFGAMAQNLVAPNVAFGSQKAAYPRVLEFSPAVVWPFSRQWKGVAALQVAKADQESLAFSGGLELQYGRLAALRFGRQNKGMSAGVGVRWGNLQFDYAALLEDLGLSQKLSVTLRSGQTREELEEVIRRGISQLTPGEAERLSKAYLQKADADLREERVAEALRELEAASLWDPENRDIRRRIEGLTSRLNRSVGAQILDRTEALAKEQYDKGNLLASRQYWQSALEMDPNSERAKSFIARIDGELPLDLRLKVEEARHAPPAARSAALTAAESLLAQGLFAQARAEAERGLGARADNPRLKAFLAKVAQSLRASVEARLGEADRQVKASNQNAAFELLRGVLRDDPGNVEAAVSMEGLKRMMVKVITPETRKQIDQLYYRAVDQYLKGNYAAAKPLVDQVLALDPSSEAGRGLQEKVDAALRLSK